MLKDVGKTQKDIYEYLKKKTGDPNLALLMLSQINLESNFLRSRVFRKCNNPAGIKYVGKWQKRYGATPCGRSPEGDHYARFPSLRKGLDAYLHLVREIYGVGTRKPVSTIQDFLNALRGWTGRGRSYQYSAFVRFYNQTVRML